MWYYYFYECFLSINMSSRSRKLVYYYPFLDYVALTDEHNDFFLIHLFFTLHKAATQQNMKKKVKGAEYSLKAPYIQKPKPSF